MPLFACICDDGPDGAELRKTALAAHLAHVEAHMDRYAVAGPLKHEAGPIGSMLVVKADSTEDARAFLETDPYFLAGVWSSIRIEEFAGVAGEWVGGAAWKN